LPTLIVQYVEPDFLNSMDAFSKTKMKKLKVYIRALVDHIEHSETIDDLRQINLSNIELSKTLHLQILAGKRTELQFPKIDVYLFKFDDFKLFFCLRGQVCTLLRIEGNG
jgi:hypothetical protein